MTTQRTFEPHKFEPYAEADNICRHCDRGRYALHHEQPRPEQAAGATKGIDNMDRLQRALTPQTAQRLADSDSDAEHDDAPAAPERGEWRVTSESRSQVKRKYAAQICHEHNEHSTLIAQRERLLRLLRPVTSPTACYCAVMGSEKCWHCEARELITTTEQEGTRER